MKAVLVNYNYSPDWIKDYDFDYLIYDRSDDGIERDLPNVIKTTNVGNADYDRLRYLVDNYDILPEVFLWSKSNLFKYITKEEFDKLKDNKTFTPLLTQNHKTYSDKFGVVCYYSGGIYHERDDNWYVHQFVHNCPDFKTFANEFGINPPAYIPFAPGGNYILTREVVHRYSRDMYDKMASTLPYSKLPAEAHFCERLYYLLWS